MNHKMILFLILTITTKIQSSQKSIWFIVHGTFAKNSSWHRPGGDFYEQLKQSLPKETLIVPFQWSGNNNKNDRIKAGRDLFVIINHICTPHDNITIVGHSHGGTVAIIALNIFNAVKSSLHFDALFTLATPINLDCLPNPKKIKKIFNIFSVNDVVQKGLFEYQRIMPDSHNIYNIRAIQDDKTFFDHSDMRNILIAQSLPAIQKYSTVHQCGNNKPLLLQINNTMQQPIITPDYNQKQIIKSSDNALKLILKEMLRTKNKNNTQYKNTKVSWIP